MASLGVTLVISVMLCCETSIPVMVAELDQIHLSAAAGRDQWLLYQE